MTPSPPPRDNVLRGIALMCLGVAMFPFLNAAAHGVFFYLSWFFALVFLVTLVDSEKRFLHDILSGVLVIRRR